MEFPEIQQVLRQLDIALARAIALAEEVYGADAISDPYRGLHITHQEIDLLLQQQPGASLFSANSNIFQPDDNLPFFQWLRDTFSLSIFEASIVLIAIAPEIDLRYEKIYAYLQNDVTRKRPGVDLVLNLLCCSGEDKVLAQSYFSPDAPLIKQGLLHLLPDFNQPHGSLLSHYIQLDAQLTRWLLGQKKLDPRLSFFCHWLKPHLCWDDLPLTPEFQLSIKNALIYSNFFTKIVHIYFYHPRTPSQLVLAVAIASELNCQLLVVDLNQLLLAEKDFRQTFLQVFLEAALHQGIIYVSNFDLLLKPELAMAYQSFLAQLRESRSVTIIAGQQPWQPPSYLNNLIAIPGIFPNAKQRQVYWQLSLGKFPHQLTPTEMANLAERFQFTPEQISNAVNFAHNQTPWQIANQQLNSLVITFQDLLGAARRQCQSNLNQLAQKVEVKYTWEQLILPSEQLAQLQELCNQAKYRNIVYEEWGFGNRLSLGKGLNLLFTGSPGTGKTMAAEIISSELYLELYKIDLSQVVSKYIGETEKNLDKIFQEAIAANAILFFDEADALFGKRSEVKEARDRYANQEISYLLQKIEEYEGIAILATNFRQNLDEAFLRRLSFIIQFPFPEEEQRQRIWGCIFPSSAPLGEDVDLGILAQQIALSGGNIKNIALNAAFLAVGDGGIIKMKHLIKAAQREYQKLGRNWTIHL